MFRRISRNVYLLGLLSLFNDLTADMITPLLPAYLLGMGLGPGFLGLMEGLANSLSNVTMLFSGWYADRKGRTKTLTVAGYFLSTFSRPFLAIPWPQITITARILDRIGKGIRTAPRDQLITTSVDKKNWGEAFGIQRAMDHSASLVGPVIATWLLAATSIKLSTLFLFACIPSVLSVLLLPPRLKSVQSPPPNHSGSLAWSDLPKPLKKYVIVIFLSALSTPSELFLLLKMRDMGLPQYQMPLAWALMTLATLVATYLGGLLSDRWSRRRTIALGWILFAVVYIGFAFNSRMGIAWILMAGYGLHMGVVEPAERAYPAMIAEGKSRATAIGWYYFAYGMGMLPASLLFGVLWDHAGPRAAFLIVSGLTILTTSLLALLPSDRKRRAVLR